jgi:hypothetical protein
MMVLNASVYRCVGMDLVTAIAPPELAIRPIGVTTVYTPVCYPSPGGYFATVLPCEFIKCHIAI